MGLIKNYDDLAITPERKIVLDVVNAGLEAIQPDHIMNKNFSLTDNQLKVLHKTFDLQNYEHVYLIGFGKGSAGITKLIEEKLGDSLTEGYCIDVREEHFNKVQFTLGTHPLPSQENIDYTKQVIEKFSSLTEKDLVLVVICGGGSVMLAHPQNISLEQLTDVNKALLHAGMDITKMNTVRKHLDTVKGGGLAQILHPATVASLIFSDVPGNDLSFIASGPTVKDTTSIADAFALLDEYKIREQIHLSDDVFIETPKDDAIFENVHNCIMVSNVTALDAMKDEALHQGVHVLNHSDRVQGDAHEVAERLIEATKPGHLLLAAGETTIKVEGEGGKGGRNQELVLSTLLTIDEGTVIVSIASDGQDNTDHAGAIGDGEARKIADEKEVDIHAYLEKHDSYTFFEKTGQAILTEKLPSNVADLFVVYKK
jgi:glycerate 2-kinase